MIISHSRKFIFIHIHKTAGESITLALARHLSRSDLTLGTTLGGKVANWFYPKVTPLKKHSTALAVREWVGSETWNSYFKFSFVRDPVDRALSLYGYYAKLAQRRDEPGLRSLLNRIPGSQGRDLARWPTARAFLETTSFSEFIRHPSFSPANPGSRPQWKSVCDADGRPLLDFVGRFETLAGDFAGLSERLGLPYSPLPKRNASVRDEAPRVSPEDRAHLAEIYRRDFEIFGYPATEPAMV